jgi:hypothetical protein
MSSVLATGPEVFLPTAYSFTRPADTTAYAAGDLVANSVTAGSVVAMSWANVAPEAARQNSYSSFYIPAVRLRKSTASVTNAQFRVHLFQATPTFVTNGDNSAIATVVATGAANWLGSYNGTFVAAIADGAIVNCLPTENAAAQRLPFLMASGSTVYGIVEALAAYTPGNAEVFTVQLLVERH